MNLARKLQGLKRPKRTALSQTGEASSTSPTREEEAASDEERKPVEGANPSPLFSQSRESSPIGETTMDYAYRVVMGFEPTGPQFASPFSTMDEAFEAYNRCIELPGKVSVFVFKKTGNDWKPLLGRASAAWKKALKAGNTPTA